MHKQNNEVLLIITTHLSLGPYKVTPVIALYYALNTDWFGESWAERDTKAGNELCVSLLATVRVYAVGY